MNSETVMNRYRYTVAYRQDFEDAYFFESHLDENEVQSLAYEASVEYYVCQGAWKDEWPLSIEVYKEDGSYLGVFEMEKIIESRI